MFNQNSGYVGFSRSVRSSDAIEHYETPISLMTKKVIQSFLQEQKEEQEYDETFATFTLDELAFLDTVAVSKWKFVARQYVTPSSWHHTSSYYNKTDHYELELVAKEILALKEDLDVRYQANQASKKATTAAITYGYLRANVWGGTRRHPKIVGEEEVVGIVIGDWLYCKAKHQKTGGIEKYKTTANKVISFQTYDSYDALITTHKQYKGTKLVFNRLIKEKIGTAQK